MHECTHLNSVWLLFPPCQCTETWIVAVSTSFCCSCCRPCGPCRHQPRDQVLCSVILSPYVSVLLPLPAVHSIKSSVQRLPVVVFATVLKVQPLYCSLLLVDQIGPYWLSYSAQICQMDSLLAEARKQQRHKSLAFCPKQHEYMVNTYCVFHRW